MVKKLKVAVTQRLIALASHLITGSKLNWKSVAGLDFLDPATNCQNYYSDSSRLLARECVPEARGFRVNTNNSTGGGTDAPTRSDLVKLCPAVSTSKWLYVGVDGLSLAVLSVETVNKQTDRQAGRQTDRQTDRQNTVSWPNSGCKAEEENWLIIKMKANFVTESLSYFSGFISCVPVA